MDVDHFQRVLSTALLCIQTALADIKEEQLWMEESDRLLCEVNGLKLAALNGIILYINGISLQQVGSLQCVNEWNACDRWWVKS